MADVILILPGRFLSFEFHCVFGDADTQLHLSIKIQDTLLHLSSAQKSKSITQNAVLLVCFFCFFFSLV